MIKSINIRALQKIIGVFGLLIALFIIIIFSNIIDFTVKYGEQHFSTDHHFNPLTIVMIKIFFIFLVFVFFTIGMLLLLGIRKHVSQFISQLFSRIVGHFFDVEKAGNFFVQDKICPKKRFPLRVLIFSSITGLVLHFTILYFGRPSYEGYMEKISSLLLLIASIIIFISISQTKKLLAPPKTRRKIIMILLVISGILFLMFGEEISWGQRIFGWDSTGVFDKYNYQREINFHNFLNPINSIIYPIVGMGSFVLFFLARLFPVKNTSYILDLIYPHPSLFFLLLLMTGASFNGQSEFYESLLSLFALLYSIRIFICMRHPQHEYQS